MEILSGKDWKLWIYIYIYLNITKEKCPLLWVIAKSCITFDDCSTIIGSTSWTTYQLVIRMLQPSTVWPQTIFLNRSGAIIEKVVTDKGHHWEIEDYQIYELVTSQTYIILSHMYIYIYIHVYTYIYIYIYTYMIYLYICVLCI